MFSKHDIAAFLNRRLRGWDMVITRRSDLWRPTVQLGHQPQPQAATQPARAPMLRSFGLENATTIFDFAVVMPTTLRSTIVDALRSVFAQDFAGTVQTLIGIDVPHGGLALIETFCQELSENHSVLLFDLGYSTSARHGGLHPSWDGGVLRTALSYLAASSRVAYLDDDNWWAPAYLTTLRAALEGHDWASSNRLGSLARCVPACKCRQAAPRSCHLQVVPQPCCNSR